VNGFSKTFGWLGVGGDGGRGVGCERKHVRNVENVNKQRVVVMMFVWFGFCCERVKFCFVFLMSFEWRVLSDS
jgi:hypothetical protein